MLEDDAELEKCSKLRGNIGSDITLKKYRNLLSSNLCNQIRELHDKDTDVTMSYDELINNYARLLPVILRKIKNNKTCNSSSERF